MSISGRKELLSAQEEDIVRYLYATLKEYLT